MSLASANAVGLAFGAVGFIQPIIIADLSPHGLREAGDLRRDRLHISRLCDAGLGWLGGRVGSWAQFFFVTGGLLLVGALIVVRGFFDDREWRRQKEAEEAARRAAAE